MITINGSLVVAICLNAQLPEVLDSIYGLRSSINRCSDFLSQFLHSCSLPYRCFSSRLPSLW